LPQASKKEHTVRIAARIAAVVAAIATTVAVTGTPAAAATGGGCQNGFGDRVRPCISFLPDGGGTLHADWYLNVAPTSTVCKVEMEIWTNGSRKTTYTYYPVDHTGKYGPRTYSVAWLPSASQSGYTRLVIRDCSNFIQAYATSPTIYFFA
jgi:hypothetical protein